MLNAIILGLLQGITEFLPVSSSAHLVIVQSILPGFEEPAMIFDVFLHAGTLVAVFAYFWQDLCKIASAALGRVSKSAEMTVHQARWLILAVLVGSIPAGVVGVLWESKLEEFFAAPRFAAMFLCGTALILTMGELLSKRTKSLSSPQNPDSWWRWIIVGLAQSIALLPGISRSGATIAAGLGVGWNRQDAARFSFFLMMPAVSGAVVLKMGDVIQSASIVNWPPIIVGTTLAGVSGYMSIWILLQFIKMHRLYPFALYCLLMGGGFLLFGPG